MTHRRLLLNRLTTHLRQLDLGLLLALLLALVAAMPFLTRPGLPRGTDAELHVFRAAELGYSLRAGDIYPRWAPDFYYGHGYPIFNYYAPLTYYLANFFDVSPGVNIVSGVKFNDVDVLFVTSKPKKVIQFCLEISKVRTKPVVPLILNERDFLKAIQEKNNNSRPKDNNQVVQRKSPKKSLMLKTSLRKIIQCLL